MKPHRQILDEDSASRMLQGLVHPDDAPPGYSSVADLLATAAQLPALDEDADAATISAMVEAIRAGAPAPQAPRRKSMLGKIFAGKALVAMATVALTASGAAAATGSLPLVQDVVAETVSHVGVDIPKATRGNSADHRQDGEHRQSDKAHSDKAQSDKGQSGEDHGKPVDADETTGDNGKGKMISDLTHSPELEGQPKGPVVSDAASGGKSQAGEHGKPADGTTPPAGSDDDGKGDDKVTPPVTTGSKATPPVTTGSKTTGEERSGKDLEKPGNDKNKGSGADD